MKRDVPHSAAISFEQLSIASTIDLLEVLWRRKRLFCAAIAAGILVGLLYYSLATRTYVSSADVLLVQKRPEVVTGDRQYESSFEDYVATHLALIVSPMIVNRAIEIADLGSLKTFDYVDPEEEDLAELIIGQLAVSGGHRNLGDNADSILTLEFQGTEPEECPVVVEAVLNAYKTILGEIYAGMSEDTMKLIEEARSLLQDDLQSQEDAYVQFRQQSPLVSRGADEVNPLQDRLATIETQRSELLVRRVEIEGQLQTILNAMKNNYDDQQLLAFVIGLRSQAAADDVRADVPATLNSQLFQLVDQEQQLLEHFGPNHPHVATIRQRIATTRQLLALPTSALMRESSEKQQPEADGEEANPVELYKEYLEQELDRIDVSEKLLTKLYQREHEAAKELSAFQLKDERFRRNIDRTQQLYDGVISQLQEASLIKGYGGFEARVIANPLLGEKSSPRGKIVLPLSTFAGMCLGFVLVVIAEVKDKSFRSRREIQNRLGLTVIAQIPRYAAANEEEQSLLSEKVQLDPVLCTYFQPHTPQTEAFRNLRTALLFNYHREACRIIQLTSPSPDDGTSTIAANLAVSIAQLERRVLLVDADLHRPRQHKLFGIDAEKALNPEFTAGQPLSEAIYETAVDNLWLLPAGPLRANGSELFASPKFRQFLETVREQYDVILIDTEPLLAISDPCVIASQVDGVLMALRPTFDSRWRAERAKEMLDMLGVQPIGVVVNGVGGLASRTYSDELIDYDQAHDKTASSSTKQFV